MSFDHAVTKQYDKMASFSFFRKSFVESVKKRLFHTFGIEEVLIKRLENISILKPTAIQEKALRPVLDGKNTIINAETGSGKTLYFFPIRSFFQDHHMLLYSYQVLNSVINLKTKKKQAHLARRQKVSRERNALQDRTMSSDHTEQPTKRPRNLTPANQGKFSQAVSVPKRQFVFVAATLPHHGPKAAFNVLKEWMPEAEYVSTDLVHHPVPTVGIFYVRVGEPGKLPELLRCLNALVRVVKRPIANDKKKIIGEENVCSNSNVSKQKELSSLSFPQDQNKSYDESCNEPIRFSNLRVLVFANSSKMAERAFCFLSDIREMEENCFIPWKHVTQNGVTTTTRREKGDDNDDFFEDSFNSFVTQTGDKDVWKGTVGLIHKKLPVNERSQTLLKFKSGELKVLICTDLASRGLDIPDVSHVIQLDFAPNAAAVLHRTGRTARAGSSGKVINFVTEHDEDLSKAIQACEENSHSNSYECHFSRNRQFRWRLKKKQLRKMNR
ncbi:uncharacterized protein [Montipora capricornis]|uniref:uncharacterized protein isoform X3 n=1 Tax=Montipora capricornis TaxID=246305 RepID=UPI0035F16825